MKEKQSEAKRFRFNIIDVLVIAVLIAIVVILVIKVSAAKSDVSADSIVAEEPISGPDQDFQPNLEFVCVAESLQREVAEEIAAQTANRVYNSNKLLDAYVTDVQLEPCYVTAVSADGTAYTVEDARYVNVRFTVQTAASGSTASVSGNFNPILGAVEIRVGKGYTLKTMAYEIPTTITSMEALNNG